MPNYARKTTLGKTTHSTTAPNGAETALNPYQVCRYCERSLVPDGITDGTQFVFTTASGPSCPTCARNPLIGAPN